MLIQLYQILWDVDTNDWKRNIQESKDIYNQALSSGGQGSFLVLAHDIQAPTVDQLAGYMIDTARERGYQLVTLGECLGDPVENWYRSANTGGGLR